MDLLSTTNSSLISTNLGALPKNGRVAITKMGPQRQADQPTSPNAREVRGLLEEISKCEDLEQRRALIAKISLLDADAHSAELASTLGLPENADLQNAVHKRFAEVGSPAVVKALLARAHSHMEDERLCREIGATLQEIGNPTSVLQLSTGLNSPVFPVFLGSLASLARIGNEDAVRVIVQQTANDNDRRREALIEGISRIKSPNVLPILREALDHSVDEQIRAALTRTIESITSAK